MNIVEKVIEELFENNAKKMESMCRKEIMKFGWLNHHRDFDDFYSQVAWDMAKAGKKFKKEHEEEYTYDDFKKYILGVIKFSVDKEMKKRNRKKRKIIKEKIYKDQYGNTVIEKEYVHDMSLDAEIGENMTLKDIVMDKLAIDDSTEYSEKMLTYLKRLSKKQKNILMMLSDGYSASDIMEIFNISKKEYDDCISAIRSYKNIEVLL